MQSAINNAIDRYFMDNRPPPPAPHPHCTRNGMCKPISYVSSHGFSLMCSAMMKKENLEQEQRPIFFSLLSSCGIDNNAHRIWYVWHEMLANIKTIKSLLMRIISEYITSSLHRVYIYVIPLDADMPKTK